MSEDEDNQSLIDEIQALEYALDQKKKIGHCKRDSSNAQPKEETNVKAEDDVDNGDDDLSYDGEDEDLAVDDSYDSYSCSDLQDLLELNRNLLELIQKTQERMTILLEECQHKQRTVEKLISQQSTSWQTYKIVNHNAGMPYFKDRNLFCPKRNEDAEIKLKNGELRLVELQRILKWNQIDKNNLLKSIQQEVRLNLLKNSDEITPELFAKKTSRLPMDVKKAIGPLGVTKFDWMKIANSISDNRHTAEECENMWNLYLHPDINKKGWLLKEEKDLDRIAEEYGFEDWDGIAKTLNTKRTGYLCFLHYNTKNWKNLMKGQCWSRDDDEILTHLVTKTKMGDYIPWGYIASCMNNFTKQQIYFRWTYSLAPHLKKGRFSVDEDKKLKEAVAKYGENFSKISALVMNHRTNIQLKEHYQTIVMNTQEKKVWTLEDDEKLMQLRKKHGSNWAKISNEMTNVTRVQARHRYASLIRFMQKGVALENIMREEFLEDPLKTHTIVTYTNKSPWARENKEIHVKHVKVDDQLVNFFKRETMMKKMENQLGKSYHPDKLREDTKKLVKILQKLNANLNFNSMNDDFEISEMNQELLESLLNYKEEQRVNINKKIENVRIQMFGPREHIPENERFIPPLPFNFRLPKCKKTQVRGINFTLNTNEYHKEEYGMTFESKYVEECLGEEITSQFGKLKKIICKDSNVKDKVYYLKCKPFSKSVFCFEPVENIVIENDSTSGTLKQKYDWRLNKMVPVGFNNVCGEKQIVEGVPITVIEPNKTTLKAYQELLSISRRFPSDTGESGNQQLTYKGCEALSLFKRRYEQLFHVPTGLSRIIPPDVVDESAFLPALEKFQKKTSQNKNKRMKKND